MFQEVQVTQPQMPELGHFEYKGILQINYTMPIVLVKIGSREYVLSLEFFLHSLDTNLSSGQHYFVHQVILLSLNFFSIHSSNIELV